MKKIILKYRVLYYLKSGKKVECKDELFNSRIEAHNFAREREINTDNIIGHEVYMVVEA